MHSHISSIGKENSFPYFKEEKRCVIIITWYLVSLSINLSSIAVLLKSSLIFIHFQSPCNYPTSGPYHLTPRLLEMISSLDFLTSILYSSKSSCIPLQINFLKILFSRLLIKSTRINLDII